MEETPFPGLKIDSSDFLNDIKGRSKCPRCGKSRKFYCYTCYVPLGGPDVESQVPRVKLPIKIDILKHPQEIDGKSTAVHAAILAPDDVTIYTYPTIPQYDPDKVLLVYPGPGAVEFEDYVKTHFAGKAQSAKDSDSEPIEKRLKSTAESEVESGAFERIVFIDSTWHTVNKIGLDQRLKGLQRIELKTRTTKFWRHQTDKPNTYLATIEAIYYFLREYDAYMSMHHVSVCKQNQDSPLSIDSHSENEYQGQYDNLLFYFCFYYKRIREEYKGGENLRAYQEIQRKQNKCEKREDKETRKNVAHSICKNKEENSTDCTANTKEHISKESVTKDDVHKKSN